MNGPLITVVMPALNAAGTIGEQLAALAAQDTNLPWQLVVVDNGSSDETIAIAESFRAGLRDLVVTTCSRPGPSAARNLGARVGSGDLLLYCDADDRVAPGWVDAMARALQQADVVGGAFDNDTFNDGAMERHPAGVPVTAGFLPRAITANLGVRRSAWSAVGGFAEDYGYGSEDTEFCWRLQVAGYRIGYAEQAVVAYRYRSSLRAVAVKAYKSGRSRARLFRDFAPHGMPRPRLTGVAWRWVRIVLTAPLVPFSVGRRWWWVNESAAAAGRIVGSVRFRVRYL
ncbi:MAG TPA: glycosyltransferase [Cellulomonas sp.]|uniref:glycosyltransferase family 2 protein n=1 Tax=Cellulomonas sp. TaxID=40001 RepID=UPI002E351D30|nr:glycosyltransferase [Cellulomonas sp.]HEX5333026.1 glycosyltransferase [Cellulomonas sp.]